LLPAIPEKNGLRTGKDVAVSGFNMIDLISHIRGTTREGEAVETLDLRMNCGGKGENHAITATRLGSQTLMLTRERRFHCQHGG